MPTAARTLTPLRWGAGLIRGRFEVEWNGAHYVVDCNYFDLDERVHLYRDGRLVDTAKGGKARFVIADGVRIEAALSKFGMKYVRLRRAGDRSTRPLQPMRGTAEAWRAEVDRRHPVASRAVGIVAVLVLIIMLLLELPQLINLVGTLTPHVGLAGFGIPEVSLTGPQNAAVVIIGGLAGLERALSMKHNPLLDD